MKEGFNIANLLTESAKKDPARKAIIYKDQSISFGEFEKQVNETATYFQHKGIRKGDRVLVFIPMNPDLYRTVLALFRIGAVAVFLDEWVSRKRMEACCRIAQCQAFIGIFKARVLSLFSSELRRIPLHLGTGYHPGKTTDFSPATSLDDTALITFTTGSSGIPKAAKRSHGLLLAQFKALVEMTNPIEGEIDMPVLPIVLLMNLGRGTTSVIPAFKASKPETLNPEKIASQITEFRVTRIIASPFFIKRLARHVLDNNLSLPSLRKIFTGGAPVFPGEAKLYLNAFPGVHIEIVYGSTEAEPISSITAAELTGEKAGPHLKGLAVGHADANSQVKIIRIIDEIIQVNSLSELRELEVSTGNTGEIIVSGDHVLKEYLHNETALKRNKIFIGDICWHRTGDSGFLDSSGNLYLTGPCKMLIRKNGEVISPFIYENEFQGIAGIETGTVLLINEKITAIIELNDESRKEAIRSRLTSMPFEDIQFIKKIPRDPRHNSKIEYQKLALLTGNHL